MLLFGIVILASGCTHRPYRENLPTVQTQKHTEVTYDQHGQVIQRKEVIDEATLQEPAEKYERRFYGGNRRYNGGNGYYGRSAIRVCIIGCGDGGHHGHHRH